MAENREVKAIVAFGERGVQLGTLDEAYRFATALASSGDMCPKHFQGKPEAILAAIQRGAEINLGPMQSLDSIHVVQGRASLSGATCLALMSLPHVMESGKRTQAGFRVTEDGMEGYCWSWRKGDDEPIETTYTEARAKKMGLWNKAGSLWVKDPGVMLKWRAVGEHSRNYYSDVTKGLYLAEEVRDFEPIGRRERDITPDSLRIEGPGDPLLETLRPPEVNSELPIVEQEAFEAGDEVDPDTGEVIPGHIK